MRWQAVQCYLAQHFSTRGPAAALAQPVEEPEQGEHGDGGGPGEGHVDATHQEEADREEPAGADLVRQHAADELTDGVRHGLAAGDQTCRDTMKVTVKKQCAKKETVASYPRRQPKMETSVISLAIRSNQ